jgi:uncharacterized cupredoxin-like copper-binding protein
MNRIPVLAATALLAATLVACGGSASTPAPAGSPAPGANGAASASIPPSTAEASGATGDALPITERDFKFDTPDVTVDAGAVSLAVTNAGPTVHDLTVRDGSGTVLGETADLKPNTSETLTLTIPAGSYVIFCSLPGHESLGLKGTLTVK